MNPPNLNIIRIPSMTMLFAGKKCLYKIIHFRHDEEKSRGSIKPGYYIMPTGFAGATISQSLADRPFRSQKRAVDFCRSALYRFHQMVVETRI